MPHKSVLSTKVESIQQQQQPEEYTCGNATAAAAVAVVVSSGETAGTQIHCVVVIRSCCGNRCGGAANKRCRTPGACGCVLSLRARYICYTNKQQWHMACGMHATSFQAATSSNTAQFQA